MALRWTESNRPLLCYWPDFAPLELWPTKSHFLFQGRIPSLIVSRLKKPKTISLCFIFPISRPMPPLLKAYLHGLCMSGNIDFSHLTFYLWKSFLSTEEHRPGLHCPVLLTVVPEASAMLENSFQTHPGLSVLVCVLT
jgi:hypothetical protein